MDESNLIKLSGLVKDISESWRDHKKSIEENLSVIRALGSAYNKVTPSEIVKGSEAIEKANEKARLSEIRLQQAREKAFDKYEAQLAKKSEADAKAAIIAEKNTAKQNAELEKLANYYNVVQNKINKLTPEYNNLATKQALSIKLTDQESNRLSFLTGKILGYENALKSVDAQRGKFGREVGNYSKATENLNRSLTTIATEIPNFFQSIEIGVRSITNNIQQVRDGVKGVRKENEELALQGKKTESILSLVLKSLFSWQTALFVGVGLLSKYSDSISDWVVELFKGKEALDELGRVQDEYNKKRLQSNARTSQEVDNIRKYIDIAKNADSKYSADQVLVAFQKLREAGKYYFKDLKNSEIFTEKGANALYKFTKAIEAQGKAEDLLSANQSTKLRINEIQSEIDARDNYVKRRKEALEAEFKTERQRQDYINQLEKAEENRIKKRNKLEDDLLSSGTELGILFDTQDKIELERQLGILRVEEAKQRGEINKNIEESIVLDYTEKKAKKTPSEKREDIKSVYDMVKARSAEKDGLQALIEKLKQQAEWQKEASSDPEFRASMTQAIKFYDDLLKALDDPKWQEPSMQKGAEKNIDALQKQAAAADGVASGLRTLRAQFAKMAEGFTDDIFSGSGLESFKTFFDGSFDLGLAQAQKIGKEYEYVFLTVSESAQEAFNLIAQLSQNNFDAEYAQLEKRKELALKFAGESAYGRDAIESQFDDKRRQIRKREAESQKKIALFNIGINTAQALVAQLAATPLPFGTGFLAVIAALGAAQAAVVASQEIPQFWRGTDNAPEGWAMVDEKGAEMHTDSKGNIKSMGSEKGANLRYLKRGDKIKTASQTDAYKKQLADIAIGGANLSPSRFSGVPDYGVYDNGGIDYNELRSIVNSIPSAEVHFDESGYTKYTKESGVRTKSLNDALNITSSHNGR